MTSVRANPELVRNVRAQLRPDRMITVAVVCGVLSLVVGFSTRSTAASSAIWGFEFLRLALTAQAVVLVFGGGLAALHAISREKDTNTFDFQRITRLTPLELTLGKVLGAPALMYCIVLCLMPAVLVGAIADHARPSFVLAGYAVLFLGSITLHALALLLSLFLERGVAVAGGVLLFVGLWLNPLLGARLWLNLGSLSPFFAGDVITQTTWAVDRRAPQTGAVFFPAATAPDVFFGWPVHHGVVLVALYLIFTAWFLLAVARNIKRDPAIYEIFTPAQAVGFALVVNLIFVGFFRWSRFGPVEAQAIFLGVNAALFFALGLVLIRNRDRVRRLRLRRAEPPDWPAAAWPAPCLAVGTLLVGLGQVAILPIVQSVNGDWDPPFALFRVAVFSAWVLRDVQYLQWMNLRRGPRPLRVGLLYLAVFYVCAGVVVRTLHLFGTPQGLASAALAIPGVVLTVSPGSWLAALWGWLAALGVQVAVAGLLVGLQRGTLAQLSGPTTAEVAAAHS